MMLRSKSRAGSVDSGKKRQPSIFSRTISASKLCRSDALTSQIDSDALVSLERKSSVKHLSENRLDRLLIMQKQMGKLEEDLRETRKQLGFVEEEKSRAINALSEMKHVAHEANIKSSDEVSRRKSRELDAEVRTLKELLANKQEELNIKDKNIKFLKLELEKAKECEKDASLGKVKEGLSHVKTFKIRVTDWLSDFRRKVQELEDELENRKLSESKIFDAWLSKTRQFEQIKIELEESKLEIASLNEKMESLDTSSKQNGRFYDHSCNGETKNLKFELELAKENEKLASSKAKALNDEMRLLKNEMKLASEAEEKSRKALDDLALVLKEVASEASEAKEKLSAKELELGQVMKEAGNLKEMIKSTTARCKKLLDEAKKETEVYRNTVDRLKLEAEESLMTWNGKEMSFIACIKDVEEERDLALHETSKLNESLKEAEHMTKAAREENYRLRDILKQAVNEANAAKAAADLARQENSQLKDRLAKKG